MYKILNDQSTPHLRASFTELNNTNINYNLRNIETDLALPRPKPYFLKHSFKYSGAMLWNNHSYKAKTAQSLSKFKIMQTCLFAFCWIALFSKNSHQHI